MLVPHSNAGVWNLYHFIRRDLAIVHMIFISEDPKLAEAASWLLCLQGLCTHSSSTMLGRVASCAGKLLAHQLGAGAASSAVQQAAAAAGCSGLLQKLGEACRGYSTNSHDIFNIHKHAPHNNWNTEFDFTPDNYKRVRSSKRAFQAVVYSSSFTPHPVHVTA